MLALLGAVFALLAIAPLWASLPARAHLPLRILLTAAALFVAGKVLFSEPDEEQPVARRPLELPDRGYVGSAHCRACHPEQHATWHDSFHRTMTQVLSRDALLPKFDRVQQLDWFGKPVKLEWRGDELWCEFHRGGGTPADVRRPIVQLTGSHHLQVLWYSTGEGRELAPLPLVWRIDEAKWLPITSVFVVPPELREPPEPGIWNQRCQACHTTESRPRLDGEHPDTLVGEFGIACEACHGPGGAHMAQNQNPLRRYQHHDRGGDDTI